MNSIPKKPICPKVPIIHRAEKEEQSRKDNLTLNCYINDLEKTKPNSSYQFPQLIMAIQSACKTISAVLRRSGISQMIGLGLEASIRNAEAGKLEKYFNEVFIRMVYDSYTTCLIACKDSQDAILVEGEKSGRFIVVFNVADTTLNVESAACIGTTFGIFTRVKQSAKVENNDVLQAASGMIAGGYVLYGTSTTLVLAHDSPGIVNGFTLDLSIGEFLLSDYDIKTPRSARIYSVNEGNTFEWEPALTTFIESLKNIKMENGWAARYSGSLVADFHRVLKCGGYYMHPPAKENPSGKCGPLAFVMKHAGGLATNGKVPIIDLVPEKIHEKTPIYCGSIDDMIFLMKSLGAAEARIEE